MSEVDTTPRSAQCWLMKAEPETRLEKGKDVAFSAQMFEEAGTTQWDGVRNHQAKKFMKEQMRVGDRVLFYHSNCKLPGIAALASVYKEGYPDYTAWDPEHPYYDAKSNKENPTWFMVDVKFERHLPNYVSLKALQQLAVAASDATPPYLSAEQVEAIKAMPLLTRGRLSVQPVDPIAYEGICAMGDQGDFGNLGSSAQTKKAIKRKAPSADVEAKSSDDRSLPRHSETQSTGTKRRLRSNTKQL